MILIISLIVFGWLLCYCLLTTAIQCDNSGGSLDGEDYGMALVANILPVISIALSIWWLIENKEKINRYIWLEYGIIGAIRKHKKTKSHLKKLSLRERYELMDREQLVNRLMKLEKLLEIEKL